jgi:hypothetical protein
VVSCPFSSLLSFSQVVCFLCCLVTLCNCRPQNDKIDIHDTSDEFVITKPESTDPKYTDFLDELYKKDQEKQPAKSKRDTYAQDDKIIYDYLNSFDDTPIVEEIVSHHHIEMKRGKRMILFRYLDRSTIITQ